MGDVSATFEVMGINHVMRNNVHTDTINKNDTFQMNT